MNAPIALFVYNRPDLTKKTVEALLKNSMSSSSALYIFADGPKKDASEEAKQKIAEVQEYCKSITGFATIQHNISSTNKGLATSIIDGVSSVLKEHSQIIVLEDDLIVSPYFLQYMNEALTMYEHNEEVISIHAYAPELKGDLPETFFIKGADCWGWATWKRGWDLFEPDGQKLLAKIENTKLAKNFDFGGNYHYTAMLRQQAMGLVDSWAIRWYASAFLHNKLTLHPRTTLIRNVGFRDDATHTKSSSKLFDSPLAKKPIQLMRQPLIEHMRARKALGKALSNNRNIVIRLRNRLHKIFTSSPFFPKKSIPNFLKKIILALAPPILIKAITSLRDKDKLILWEGDYKNWKEASQNSSGYNSDAIVEKVKNSLVQVRDGKATFERDSVLFYEPEYNWPFLTSLLWVAGQNNGKLNILDFGGSLGSSYFQNRHMLSHLTEFSWSIVEQEIFVQQGKETFQTNELHFYESIAEAYAHHPINVVIISGVLEYLENPYAVIDEICSRKTPYILLDRTAATTNKKEIITVQTVPEWIYKASYPCRLFNESVLLDAFDNYNKILAFPHTKLTKQAYSFGCLLKLKNT